MRAGWDSAGWSEPSDTEFSAGSGGAAAEYMRGSAERRQLARAVCFFWGGSEGVAVDQGASRFHTDTSTTLSGRGPHM